MEGSNGTTSQPEQENVGSGAAAQPVVVPVVEGTAIADDNSSEHEEEGAVASTPETSANPTPGMRQSHEALFAPETTAGAAPSPTSDGAEEPPPPSAAPSSTPSVQGIAGLLPFFPPPGDPPLASSPSVHPGPADTSSIASSPIATRPHGPHVLNPEAPSFEGAGALLRRGPGIQPEVRDPMDRPDERLGGVPENPQEQVRRILRSGLYHTGMLWRRLGDGNRSDEARALEATFAEIWGQRAWQDEMARVIQDEPVEPPDREGQGDGDEDDDEEGF